MNYTEDKIDDEVMNYFLEENLNQYIDGYDKLESNIEHTNELIDDVVNASKEQFEGMNQINDSIVQLDQATQENARMADDTNKIAILTDEIAKKIVADVENKQFDSKDNINISKNVT